MLLCEEMTANRGALAKASSEMGLSGDVWPTG